MASLPTRSNHSVTRDPELQIRSPSCEGLAEFFLQKYDDAAETYKARPAVCGFYKHVFGNKCLVISENTLSNEDMIQIKSKRRALKFCVAF